MSRLADQELFHVTNDGLQPIGDATLTLRLDAAERASLRRANPGYQAAVAEEMLQIPEAV